MIPSVTKVEPHMDYTVTVIFSDGKTVDYDASHLIDKGVFSVLKDKEFFISRCCVLNDTLAWDVSGTLDNTSCLDIDPITIYQSEVI